MLLLLEAASNVTGDKSQRYQSMQLKEKKKKKKKTDIERMQMGAS
jgi:hypothetical protein